MARARAAWLMKSEPDAFGIDDLRARGREKWDGVRNFQARNLMRAMQLGDDVLFYHSSADPPGAAGLARVVRTAYPDFTSWDPASKYYDPRSTPDNDRWSMVDVEFVARFDRLVSLAEMREMAALEGMILFSRSRLSVQPMTQAQLRAIVKRAARPLRDAAAATRRA